MAKKKVFTRRQTLGLASAAGATYLGWGAGLRPSSLLGAPGAPEDTAAAASCVLTPSKVEGPYFVDELLNRSDIRVDPSDNSVQAGIPLRLTINVYRADASCAPEQGAAVDLWHCNASGVYSDVAANGTSGKKFLRGYQVTDTNGTVQFTTVYPSWYSGRTIHIHLKVRTFNGVSKTFEFTTQLFFDESVNDAVIGQSPYNARPNRDTRNNTDSIYGTNGAAVTVPLAADGSGGYAGAISLGLNGLPAGSGGGSSSGGGTTTTDKSVSASLSSARFARTVHGTRVLKLKLDLHELVSADALVYRRGRTLSRKKVSQLASGTRTLNVGFRRRVAGGSARLTLTLKDAKGNVKVLRKKLTIPS